MIKIIVVCACIVNAFTACSRWRNEKQIALNFIQDAPGAVSKHSEAMDLSPEVTADLRNKNGHFARRMADFGKDFRFGILDDKASGGRIHLSVYIQNSKPETVEFQFVGTEGKMKLISIMLHKF